ncbi:signal peptidase II [Virgibacillus halodenitrificans]|uniref:signal peptidase II n=1 Tax=Virgibacillus halodenitrificans TaxID=1482 RepID=UPI00045CFDF8|nr:signal peptidase II [Virgibacillus halodenitrificans]MEC2160227.1 signal peptidase II [Virgibacillus halodenitrificans]CDQ35920.1 Lipoprotein signal peptidase [Virgibacillus halodenitrificans]
MYLYYLFALIIIGLDQLTKWLIEQSMQIGERITIINDFFYLTSHRNKGAAWGILQGQMIFFYIITIVVVIGVVVYMQKYARTNRLLGVSLAFILGGAIGNFIDRLFRHEVVDFFDFIIFNYDFPIFNVADSALVVGVFLIIITTVLDERKERKENNK